MFALAVVDRRRDLIVLARDRMGIKPLYYAWDGRRAGLRLRAAHPRLARGDRSRPDEDGLDLYLTFGFVPSPYSLVKGVRKLPPGSILTLDAGGTPQVHRFWQPAIGGDRTDGGADGTPRPVVRETLKAAHPTPDAQRRPGGGAAQRGRGLDDRRRLRGRRDRAAPGRLLHRLPQRPVGDREEYNADAGYARRVAETLGARHHEVVCDDGGAVEDGDEDVPSLLRRLAIGLDEPVWELSFLSIFQMSRLARRQGVKVLLTGDGSDELLRRLPLDRRRLAPAAIRARPVPAGAAPGGRPSGPGGQHPAPARPESAGHAGAAGHGALRAPARHLRRGRAAPPHRQRRGDRAPVRRRSSSRRCWTASARPPGPTGSLCSTWRSGSASTSTSGSTA